VITLLQAEAPARAHVLVSHQFCISY